LPLYFYVIVLALNCILFLHPFSPSQSLAKPVKTEFARAGCTILVEWTLRLRQVSDEIPLYIRAYVPPFPQPELVFGLGQSFPPFLGSECQ
jgi:hypothetical protein